MNQLMTPQQVGAEYGVTVKELAEWRRRNIGPDYYVLGTRVIRYMPQNVDQWFRDPANSRWHDFPAEAFPEGRKEAAEWLSIEVHRPFTWWRATPEQLGARVADPDQGAFPRWESYDQDWKAIGRTIEDVGHALATGCLHDGAAALGNVRIRVQDPELSDLELKIVRSWFTPDEAVTTDPWDSGWSDGRHPDHGLPQRRPMPAYCFPSEATSSGSPTPPTFLSSATSGANNFARACSA